MQLRKTLFLAALAALPFAASAAEPRFSATLGYGALDTSGDAPIAASPYAPPNGFQEHDNDDNVLSGSFAWHVTDRWAVELWAAQSADYQVEFDVPNGHDMFVAGYKVQPITLMAHYRFPEMYSRVTPFLGAGWHWTQVNGESVNPDSFDVVGLRIEDDNGFAAVAGVDVALGGSWFVRGDVRYLDRSMESTTSMAPVTRTVGADSIHYGASIGFSF
jgi:outer membrane protein